MHGHHTLLRARDLTCCFRGRRDKLVRAVDGVSLEIARGESLGLVGESGCGKSTLGRLLPRLEEPTSGRVLFDGVDVTEAGPVELCKLRRRMQVVLQDPYASLNPHRTVGESIGLPLRLAGCRDETAIRDRVADLMTQVGLDPSLAGRFPHQFSGGQRQRVGIARALACDPDLIIADEPAASLDVSVQAQILEVLRGLQERLGLSLLFISHDLSVVAPFSHRIAVMYLGSIVEIGPAPLVVKTPAHPYTRALLAAVPRVAPGSRARPVSLAGDVPGPTAVPTGCRFRARCPRATVEACRCKAPALREVSPGRMVACHLAGVPAPAEFVPAATWAAMN